MERIFGLASLLAVVSGEKYPSYICDGDGCRCNAGYYGYIPSGHVHSGCTMCPAYATTSAEGSAGISSCICRPGYTEPAGGLGASAGCVPCAADTYKTSTDNVVCIDCPANSGTLTALSSIARGSCSCAPDYSGNLSVAEESCTQCSSTTFKLTAGPEACTGIVDCSGDCSHHTASNLSELTFAPRLPGEWVYTDPVCTNLCANSNGVVRGKKYKVNVPRGPSGAACAALDGAVDSEGCPDDTVFRSIVDRWIAVQVLLQTPNGIPIVTVSIHVHSSDTGVTDGIGIDAPTVWIDGIQVPLKTGAIGSTAFSAEREQTDGQDPMVAISGLRSCLDSGTAKHEMIGTGTHRFKLEGASLRRLQEL
jgi:hypothetical protein